MYVKARTEDEKPERVCIVWETGMWGWRWDEGWGQAMDLQLISLKL